MNLNRVPGQINVSGTTTGVDAGLSSRIQFWPNPAGDRIFVKAEASVQADLVDALGKTILSEKMSAEISEISLKEIPAGLYQLKLGSKVFRLIRK
jgi:hypothetical protein